MHPVARALIDAAAVPVAAPSANLFSRPSPTQASHVIEDLDGRIDLIVDGGPTTIGVESTVLDLTTDTPTVLRPGAVTIEMLREAIGHVLTGFGIRDSGFGIRDSRARPMPSPGMLGEALLAARAADALRRRRGRRASSARRRRERLRRRRANRSAVIAAEEDRAALASLVEPRFARATSACSDRRTRQDAVASTALCDSSRARCCRCRRDPGSRIPGSRALERPFRIGCAAPLLGGSCDCDAGRYGLSDSKSRLPNPESRSRVPGV